MPGVNFKKRVRKKFGKSDHTMAARSQSERGAAVQDEEVLLGSRLQIPWLVTTAILAHRVYYVMEPSNWWILHPDEIFQSMEVAHTELYGYGLRPYEFIPPVKGDNLSHYTLRERELGMSAMRSPLYPQYLMLVSMLVSWCGIDVNPYVLWRVSHTLMTSWLPLAVAVYARKISRSSDVAAVTSVLTATSAHLNAFGTHTIVNSFISPFLFLSLSDFVSAMLGTPQPTCLPTADYKQCCESPSKPTVPVQQCSWCDTRLWKENKTGKTISGIVNEILSWINGVPPRSNEIFPGTKECSLHGSHESVSRGVTHCNNHGKTSVSNVSHHNQETDKVISTQAVTTIDQSTTTTTEQTLQTHKCAKFRHFCSGVVLALSIYIRPDTVMLVGSLVVLMTRGQIFRFISLLSRGTLRWHIAGVSSGLLFCAADDIYFYGCLVISPVQWIRFNVLSNLASQLFGTSGVMFYLQGIFVHSAGMCTISVIFISYSAVLLVRQIIVALPNWNEKLGLEWLSRITCSIKRTGAVVENGSDNQRLQHHVVCVWVLVFIYSCMSHKESRFLHDAIVLFFIAVSGIAINTINIVNISRRSKQTVLILGLLLFSANQYSVPYAGFVNNLPNNGQYVSLSHDSAADANRCLWYLSAQNDATGLFLDRNLPDTGSFSVLHRNIPLIFLLGNEYLEFDSTSRIVLNRRCFAEDNCSTGFFSLNSVSDLIHSSNAKYLFKRLAESDYYNYGIIKSGQPFFPPAFGPVFKTKTFTVWRRKYDPVSESDMADSTANISLAGIGRTILEYEAELLKQLGNYRLSLERFRATLVGGNDTAPVYASMIYCLHKMDDINGKKRVLQRCLQKFSRQECLDGGRARVLETGKRAKVAK